MDDEYAKDDKIPKTEDASEEIWYCIKYWILRPFFRGALFGMGHFIALRLIGPYLSDRLQVKYK